MTAKQKQDLAKDGNLICAPSSPDSVVVTSYSIVWSLVTAVGFRVSIHRWTDNVGKVEICNSDTGECKHCGDILIPSHLEAADFSFPYTMVKCGQEPEVDGNQVKLSLIAGTATLCVIHVFGYGKLLLFFLSFVRTTIARD